MAREEEIVNSEDVDETDPGVPTPEAASDMEKNQKGSRPFDPSSLASVILAVVIAMVVIKMASPTVAKSKVWTPDELAKHDGTDKSLPLLLSILGSVFDVTQGRSHYGPGGGYHHFTGRDASRAFISGNFTGDGLSSSLQGLTALQVKSIDDWRTFFKKKYTYVGTLMGPYYDEHGKPTPELTRVEEEVALGESIIQQQKEDEKRFPACNSRWNRAQGGEVWCTNGYPRIVDRVSEGTYKGTTGTRCACFKEEFLDRMGLQVYEGCSAAAQRCRSAPPQVTES